jgi:N-acetylmuramoyl-L-alanine amidase
MGVGLTRRDQRFGGQVRSAPPGGRPSPATARRRNWPRQRVGRPASWGLILVLAISLGGWVVCSESLVAGFGAAWLPAPRHLPAALIMDGLVIGLDPGHGGFDPGVILSEAMGGPIRECDLNLAICLSLKGILERAGATVIMSRTGDVDLVQPGDAESSGSVIRAELGRRAEVIMAGRPALVVSVHCNAFTQAQYRGSQCFYLEDGHPGSRGLAEAIQGELIRVTGETDRLANRRQGIFLLRRISVPATTVELGFLSNPDDLRLLRRPEYQELCAMAVFFGICRFIRLPPAERS